MDPISAMVFKIAMFFLDAFVFITVPIYILVLITLWKNRRDYTLKHAFFKLMISIGIADIGTILNMILTVRLAQYGWVAEVSFIIFRAGEG